MKYTILLSLILAAAAFQQQTAWAQQPASAPTKTVASGYDAVGVVKQVDVAAGKATIAHDAIAGLNWPAMTMTFSVKDPSLFDRLTTDRRVAFTVAKQGAAYVITSVK